MIEKTILVVDDEPPIRDMLRVALEMAEYAVLEAGDAQQAHSLIVDKKPDLILLDWMLPRQAVLNWPAALSATKLPVKFLLLCLPPKAKRIIKYKA